MYSIRFQNSVYNFNEISIDLLWTNISCWYWIKITAIIFFKQKNLFKLSISNHICNSKKIYLKKKQQLSIRALRYICIRSLASRCTTWEKKKRVTERNHMRGKSIRHTKIVHGSEGIKISHWISHSPSRWSETRGYSSLYLYAYFHMCVWERERTRTKAWAWDAEKENSRTHVFLNWTGQSMMVSYFFFIYWWTHLFFGVSNFLGGLSFVLFFLC